MKYYTADPHFGHNNIIKLCDRPFGSGHAMNEQMVLRWNNMVRGNDEVFIIGDFTLGNAEFAKEFLGRLNGQIFMVPSIGHDKKWVRGWRLRHDKDFLKSKFKMLSPIHRVKDAGHTLILCHYPLVTWENSFHGSIHLHGHEHGRQGIMGWAGDFAEAQEPAFRVDVGVDIWNFVPITLEQIMRKARSMGFARKEFKFAGGRT